MPASFIMIVAGVDPSLTSTGIALVEFAPRKRPKLLHHERIRTSPKEEMPARLAEIQKRVRAVMRAHKVKHAVVEQTLMSRNAKTSLMLAQARGAILAGLCQERVKHIAEVHPVTMKKTMADESHAKKEQVEEAVRRKLRLPAGLKLSHDETDAIGVALCHSFHA